MSGHLVAEMHVHIQIEGIDPDTDPDEQTLELVRRVAKAYQDLLENTTPEGVTAMRACVDCIRAVVPPEEPDPTLDWVNGLLTTMIREQML